MLSLDEIVQCSPLGHLYSVDDEVTEVGSSTSSKRHTLAKVDEGMTRVKIA